MFCDNLASLKRAKQCVKFLNNSDIILLYIIRGQIDPKYEIYFVLYNYRDICFWIFT